jgi:hypothetical protein
MAQRGIIFSYLVVTFISGGKTHMTVQLTVYSGDIVTILKAEAN